MIFTPNVSMDDGGVHRHQAIVAFLLYYTKIYHGAFDITSLNDAILSLPRLSANALCLSFALLRVAIFCLSIFFDCLKNSVWIIH